MILENSFTSFYWETDSLFNTMRYFLKRSSLTHFSKSYQTTVIFSLTFLDQILNFSAPPNQNTISRKILMFGHLVKFYSGATTSYSVTAYRNIIKIVKITFWKIKNGRILLTVDNCGVINLKN